jgi:hypothetical protein
MPVEVFVEVVRVLCRVQREDDGVGEAEGHQAEVFSHRHVPAKAGVAVHLLPVLGVVDRVVVVPERESATFASTLIYGAHSVRKRLREAAVHGRDAEMVLKDHEVTAAAQRWDSGVIF